ncbi:MAG: hypothetical protein AB1689_09650 [Thermodesulfobacteriota bacterium]
MAAVTAVVVLLAFLAGCVTFVLGIRAGYGTSPLSSHLNWGAITLVLQLFATCIALVHARASAARAVRTREEPPRGASFGGPAPPAA